MNERNVLIHVGFTKTASTFLQDAFFSKVLNAQTLAPPLVFNSSSINELLYADDSLYADSFNKQIQDLPYGNLVLSFEAFCGSYTRAGVNRTMIAERLGASFADAKILMLIRSQREMVRAHYAQYIMGRLNGTKTLRTFFKTNYQNNHLLDLVDNGQLTECRSYEPNDVSLSESFFNYYEFIKIYKDRFKDVKVVMFEDFSIHTKDVIEDIREFAELELPADFCVKPEKVNKSKGLRDLVINRKLNAFRQINSNGFAQKACKGLLLTMDRSVSKEVAEMNEILDSVNDLYATNNQKVMDEFGIRLDKYPNSYSIINQYQ